MINKSQLRLLISISLAEGGYLGGSEDEQIPQLIKAGYIADGNGLTFDLTQKGHSAVSTAVTRINSNVKVQLENKNGELIIAGYVDFETQEHYAVYTYDRPTGGGRPMVGSMLKSDIKNIRIIEIMKPEILHNPELRELIDVIGDGVERKFIAEPGNYGKIITVNDEEDIAESVTAVGQEISKIIESNMKSRNLNDDEKTQIGIVRLSDLKYGFDERTLDRAKYIMVEFGYWSGSADLLVDYLPGSTESECIDAICRFLRLERKHKGIGPW